MKNFALLICFLFLTIVAYSQNNSATFYMDKAQKEFDKRNYDEALTTLSYAIIELPDSLVLYLMRGALYDGFKMYPEAIQDYCFSISKDALSELEALGFEIEDDTFRAHHLIGVKLPNFIAIDRLKAQLLKDKIYISFRGNYIRLAPHLYAEKADFTRLVQCIKSIID